MADQPARPDDGGQPHEPADRPAVLVTTAPPRRTGLVAVAIAVVALCIGAAAAYFYLDMRPVPVQQAAPAAETVAPETVRALDSRIAAIEGKLTTLESVVGAAQRGQADQIAAMVARVQAIEKYLGDIGQKVDRKGLDPAVADAIKVVGERLNALEGRLKSLAESAGGGADAAAAQARDQAIAALRAETDQRLAEDARKIQALTAAVAEATARAEAAIAAVKDAARGESRADRASALVLAVGQLRETLRTARPFAAELEAVRTLAAGRQGFGEALAPLDPYAARGVPIRETLTLRFEPLAQIAARAALAPEGAGWLDHTLARLSTLVTIRRTGEDETDTRPTALIARAEARLELGDLAGAVAALESLSGAPAHTLAEWLDDARARLAVDRAAAALTTLALSDLGAAAASAGAPR